MAVPSWGSYGCVAARGSIDPFRHCGGRQTIARGYGLGSGWGEEARVALGLETQDGVSLGLPSRIARGAQAKGETFVKTCAPWFIEQHNLARN
jgi:hypothetical protein